MTDRRIYKMRKMLRVINVKSKEPKKTSKEEPDRSKAINTRAAMPCHAARQHQQPARDREADREDAKHMLQFIRTYTSS